MSTGSYMKDLIHRHGTIISPHLTQQEGELTRVAPEHITPEPRWGSSWASLTHLAMILATPGVLSSLECASPGCRSWASFIAPAGPHLSVLPLGLRVRRRVLQPTRSTAQGMADLHTDVLWTSATSTAGLEVSWLHTTIFTYIYILAEQK